MLLIEVFPLLDFWGSEERGHQERGWKSPGKGAPAEMPMLSDEADQCVLLQTWLTMREE